MMSSSLAGTSGLRRIGGVGARSRIAWKMSAEVSPRKGIVPVAISYSTAPKEKRSVRASSPFPFACSGDMYAIVPSAAPGLVRCSSLIAVACAVTPAASTILLATGVTLANPKSRILAWPRFVTKMFAGFMSRWTMPSEWGCIERIGNLDSKQQHRLQLKRSIADQVLERCAVKKFRFRTDNDMAIRRVHFRHIARQRILFCSMLQHRLTPPVCESPAASAGRWNTGTRRSDRSSHPGPLSDLLPLDTAGSVATLLDRGRMSKTDLPLFRLGNQTPDVMRVGMTFGSREFLP